MSKLEQLLSLAEQKIYSSLSMIASESIPDERILQILSSPISSKYCEGIPGHRYYAGCSGVDEIELYGNTLFSSMFSAEYVNLQPHSGTSSNIAAYYALISQVSTEQKPVVLAMSMDSGGHISHSSKLSILAKLAEIVTYGVDPNTELINYDEIELLAEQHSPTIVIAGASSYPRLINFKRIADISHKHGAFFMADIAHIAGFVAANIFSSPAPYSDIVTLTTHKTLLGPRGGVILAKQELSKAIQKGILPGTQGGPNPATIAAKIFAAELAKTPGFRQLMLKILENASHFSELLRKYGLKLVTGGTDLHFVLLDLRSTPVTGRYVEEELAKYKIFVNRNTVPNDFRKPLNPSGIRIGLTAVTQLGITPEELETIATAISEIVYTNNHTIQGKTAEKIEKIVHKLTKKRIPRISQDAQSPRPDSNR